ncbi:MAG TPA: uroporphyrinogen decarboxylase family protein [Planctomycetota bacterium]|nr:uroporphyrinogen decarboxylase family protein [Planctomycetota bacterium]
MLPRERVFAALEHREPDRIPWGEHWIDYNVFEDILGRPTLCHAKMRETQAMWDGRRDEVVADKKRDLLDIVRALDMDIVMVYRVQPVDFIPEPMEQLDEVTYRNARGDLYRISATTHDLMPFEINRDAYEMPTVETYEQAIADIDKEIRPPEDSCWELVRHAVSEMKDTHFIMMCCGDVSWPAIGPTMQDQMMNLLLEPELCRKQNEYIGRKLLREMEVYAALGLDGITPCGDLGTSTGLFASPDLYYDMISPWSHAMADKAHALGLRILKHCCGHTWPVIDDLADVYDGYEGIQATAGMDIAKLKQRVGGRLCLWGGIWHEHIILGSKADIRADAAYAFEHAAPGGGYIMGSTHSLAVDAKRENILEMKRCRDAWGVYPIDPKRFV